MTTIPLNSTIQSGLDMVQLLSASVKSVNDSIKVIPRLLMLLSGSYFYRKAMEKEAKAMSIDNGHYFIMHKAYRDAQKVRKHLEAIINMNGKDYGLNFTQRMVLGEQKRFIRTILVCTDAFKQKLDQYDASNTAKPKRFKQMSVDEFMDMVPDPYLM